MENISFLNSGSGSSVTETVQDVFEEFEENGEVSEGTAAAAAAAIAGSPAAMEQGGAGQNEAPEPEYGNSETEDD